MIYSEYSRKVVETRRTLRHTVQVTFNNMPQCQSCGKMQSKLNNGDLCRACFIQRNAKVEIGNNQTYYGLTEQEIDALPELPNAWINKPFDNLTGGHLLKIIMMVNTSINQKIDALNNRIDVMENSLTTNIATTETNKEEINNNTNKL